MENLHKKLRYQSWHRGCKETDDILGPFADDFLLRCSHEDAARFQALLDESDRNIWDWLTGKAAAPAEHASLLAEIREFQNKRHAD